MTPQCPKCSTALRDDYGMVTCPSCGAIVFVDMDGMAHVASDQPVPPPDLAPADISFSSEASPMELAPMDFGIPFEALPAVAPDVAPEMKPETIRAETAEPVSELPSEDLAAANSDTAANAASDLDMNAFLGYAGEAGSAVPAGGADDGMSRNDPADPLGLSAYANSEMSNAQYGPLVISLIISGIDAKDLRDEIRQALQDSRFGWDAAALMAGIKGGVLRIDRMSPVKATIIINRIKNLSVRIRWEQNAITEIEPPLEKEP